MPYNNESTLKSHLRQDFLDSCFDDLSGAQITLALEQSASVVSNKANVQVPQSVAEADKLLQLCDAWIFAYFLTDKIQGLENELLTLVERKYKEVMGYLKDYKVNADRNSEEAKTKAEYRRSSWFTDVSGALPPAEDARTPTDW